MGKINFFGAHGTSHEHAEKIQKSGFVKGREGYWNGAVYFFDKKELGQERALNWARSTPGRQCHGDLTGNCVVLFAVISCREEAFIDLSEELWREALEALRKDTCKKFRKASKEEFNTELKKRSLLFLSSIEKEYGECKIVKAPIPLPKPEKGRGYCLAVYDETCIAAPPYKEFCEESFYEQKTCRYN